MLERKKKHKFQRGHKTLLGQDKVLYDYRGNLHRDLCAFPVLLQPIKISLHRRLNSQPPKEKKDCGHSCP
jgi:hypothetical protein